MSFYVPNETKENFLHGKTSITLKKELGRLPLANWMLYFPFRDYVIYKIKDPLRKALEAGKSFLEVMAVLKDSVLKLPKFGKENLTHPSAVLLKETLDYINEHHKNPGREEMVKHAGTLAEAEYAHDDYYAWFLDYIFVKMIVEYIKGNYKPKNLKFPIPHCWNGEAIPDRETVLKTLKEYL
jgi:hypothetical protein